MSSVFVFASPCSLLLCLKLKREIEKWLGFGISVVVDESFRGQIGWFRWVRDGLGLEVVSKRKEFATKSVICFEL
ncbi:hypothetical protein AKJ16_DCAP16768 [Drosera capensis]